jgi:hypothetical protein
MLFFERLAVKSKDRYLHRWQVEGTVMPAETVLEELTRDELTREHVQRRVDDWVARIEALYDEVESALPAGWAARRGASALMHEELMKKMGVPPRQLPTLELVRDGSVQVTFRPYGLWIIGTNGRIDVVNGRERYVLLDHARTFEAADWRIAPAAARQNSTPFKTWLATLPSA